MTWRRISVYYVLAIVLGGYFLLFEWRPGGEKPLSGPRPVQQTRFLPIPREEIQEVQVRREGKVITCRRNGQAWQVVEPPGAQVTSSLLSSFVESLVVEKETQVVDEAVKDLSPYGLDRPHATVVLKGGVNNVIATVLLGDRNPPSTAVYALKEGSPQVVLLGYGVRYYEELIFEAAGFGKN